MYNRIAFGGAFFANSWNRYLPDLNKREFFILSSLVLFTVILGIYPAIVLDGLHYSTYCLLFIVDNLTYNSLHFDSLHEYVISDNSKLVY